MSGKAHEVAGSHGPAWIEGPATALNWLTILPITGATAFDRTTGQRVVASLPVVGFVFGVWAWLVGTLLSLSGLPSWLCALLIVCSCEIGNRLMHLDGLSDVFDALGSYAPPQRAQEIISDPATGLMGMTAAFFSLALRIASITVLIDAHLLPLLIIAATTGRVLALTAVHSSRRPMRPTGFGPMMVGTIPTAWIIRWHIVVGIPSLLGVTLLLSWQFAVAYVLILSLVGTGMWRQVSRWETRFAGLNGDTTGAAVHLSTTVCLLAWACTAIWLS